LGRIPGLPAVTARRGLTGVEPGTEQPPRSILQLRQHRRREWIAAGRWGGGGHEHSVTSQTHVAGGALFTAAGLGAADAAGWMHTPVWALAVGIAWGAIAGELPDIDHPKARVSRTGVAFGVAGRVLGVPARIVGVFVRGLRVTHRGPTHSLTFLALWGAIAAPLYVASGGVVLVALAWVVGKLAAVSHTGAHLNAQLAVRFLLAHLAVVYPYAVAATALGYLSHGARLTDWSDPLGVAVRSSARCACAGCAQDPHRLLDRDLAGQAGDHDRCDPDVSRGRWNPFASALRRLARWASTRFAV
jgi:membrane-bound metal-dependent hydrolase YbcI (DUF457 family)